MREKLISYVKYFKWLYIIYFYVYGVFLKVLRVFIKTDNKLILINSFGGKKYDDSPKALYEAMLRDKRFEGCSFVWAFHNPEKFHVPGARKIKTDTFTYFKVALKAGCWITNSGIERGLCFKNKKTFYFNTWHGSPIKKMGSDVQLGNKSFRARKKPTINVMTVQSDFEANIFEKAFGMPGERFLKCGLPRNDELARYTDDHKNEIKERLGLPKDKKIILYAPTFREYERDSKRNCVLTPPMDIKKWQDELKDNFCLLFRAHYEVSSAMKVDDNDFVKNMTNYNSLNDLMIVADILISDYSSIFFDFATMDKAMIHFCYDYDTYMEKRGMYFDIRELLNGSDNEDEVIKILKSFDADSEKERLLQFRKKYLNYYGDATERSLDCIISNIRG